MLIKFLKAGNGDSILISFKDNTTKYNILIDGGNNQYEYKNNLKKEIIEIQKRNEYIDLLIITHIDQDHIKGIEYLLEDSEIDNSIIKMIWFNSFSTSTSLNNDISYSDAKKVEILINKFNLLIKRNVIVECAPELLMSKIKFSILSPFNEDINKIEKKNKDIGSSTNDYNLSLNELKESNSRIFIELIEDLNTSIENKSSIAFLMEYEQYKLLFLGDAEPRNVIHSLKRILDERGVDFLYIDYLKLSHHGSHKSLSFELFDYIKCNNFIICANGKKENLPNKLTFAKILNRKNKFDSQDNFYFNYSSVLKSLNFSDEEKNVFKFECYSENFENGYILEI
ncbi:MAG: hypothetical protein QM535_18120 [Limnohabitans sp.]|nr:hypothetical protein [Limnohabitans sp.]